MPQYKVIEYFPTRRVHMLQNIKHGNSISVDLFALTSYSKNSLSEREAIAKELIGKTVEIDEFLPVEFMASDVKVL